MLALHQIVFTIMWIGACCYAAVRGGAPERFAAAAMFSAVISTLICSIVFKSKTLGSFGQVEVGIALTDTVLFLVMTVIAVTSTRFWPIPMASMLGCGLFGHFTKPLGPDILPKAYYVTVAFWGFPTVILLAIATWRHQTRLARYGVDYGWVRQLPRRYRNGWSIDELARPLAQN